MAAVMGLLREPSRMPAIYEALVATLRYAAGWAEQLLDADALIALAELDHLEAHRAFLAENLIERAVLAAGQATPPQKRFLTPYCLYYLYGKPNLPADVRGRFPLHREVERRLGQGRRRVLMVHNIDDRQGDEIARTVPLLQALLDFTPEIEVVLVTRRLYLYAHPRIALVPIGDRQRVEAMLGERFDVVVDFFETVVREVNYDPDLEQRLRTYVQAQKPFLFLGSTKGYNHFLFETVDVDGRPLAGELGLDRLRVPNNYETTCRLIAELGLPLRRAETPPLSEWVLAGAPWPEAEEFGATSRNAIANGVRWRSCLRLVASSR